jgi:hypothetical protein
MKVFIGGSRKVSRLSAEVRRRLDQVIDKRLHVIIGDANGVDRAVQQYFQKRQYDQVEVFCMEGTCRNNLGNWPIRSVSAPSKRKDFSYYSTKDRTMAEEASVGFMIWDGKSIGTLTNVFRLICQNKKVVIYIASSKQFSDLKDKADWHIFLSPSWNDLRERIEKAALAEERKHLTPVQLGLFSTNNQVASEDLRTHCSTISAKSTGL